MENNHHLKKSQTFLRKNQPSKVCNVCGEQLYPRLSKVQDPMTKEFFSISVCTRCGLGHTEPQPANLTSYYGKDYYGNRHGATGAYCLKRSLKIVDHTNKKNKARKLLDVGCGDGSFLLAARAAGWKVAGTELNPQPARLHGLDVKESIADIENITKFDCITMWHTLEHFRDINVNTRFPETHACSKWNPDS